jgi:copper transport protein
VVNLRSLGVAHFAAYLGATMLIGGVMLVVLAGVQAHHGWATRRALWFGWVMLVVGTVAEISLRSDWLLWWRLAPLVAFVVILVRLSQVSTGWARYAAAVVGLAMALTFAGKRSAESAALWSFVNITHFAASAVWVGGLMMIAGGDRQWLNTPHHAPAIHRFSRVSLVAVPLVVLTGIAQTVHLAGGLAVLGETAWGRVLLAKASVVTLLVVVGGAALWLLRHEGPGGLRRLVITQAVVALAVVGLAAGLVAPPTRVTAESQTFAVSLIEQGTVADVSISPAAVGPNEVHIVVTPPGGNLRPIVGLTANMSLATSAELQDLPVAVESVGPNHYVGTIDLPSSGSWTIDLVIATTADQTVLMSSTVVVP